MTYDTWKTTEPDQVGESEDKPTATLYFVPADRSHLWHDGAGWYYTEDECEDEGCCGAFPTEEDVRKHIADAGLVVSGVRR